MTRTLIGINPIAIRYYDKFYKDNMIITLNPLFEPNLIEFIKSNNLQVGDDIDKKWKELNK